MVESKVSPRCGEIQSTRGELYKDLGTEKGEELMMPIIQTLQSGPEMHNQKQKNNNSNNNSNSK